MFLARKIQHGGGGEIPITSPSHPNLVAYWTMDNISGTTLFDESSNNKDATINGPVQQPGIIGDSLKGDGLDDFVALPSLVELTGNAPRAYSFWVKRGNSSAIKTIFCMGNMTSGIGRPRTIIHISAVSIGDIYLSVNDSDLYTPGGLITNSNFHHVVLQYNGTVINSTNVEIYVDNIKRSLSLAGSSHGEELNVTDENIFLFKDNFGGIDQRFFDGFEDEFRIYDRTLTVAEISELYNGGAGA